MPPQRNRFPVRRLDHNAGGAVRQLKGQRQLVKAGENTPFLTEYVAITHDDFADIVPHKVKGNESFTEPVAAPVAIANEDWQLITRYDPQTGENALHMELHLEDQRGLTQQLKKETAVYLPYPEGYDHTSQNVIWQLYHYDDHYRLKETLSLQPTSWGLRCTVDSLSPFVLAWEEGQDGLPEIPQTGDAAQPMAWLMLMALAALGTLRSMKGVPGRNK